MSTKPQVSFSGIKTFEQCPRKFYHTKVAQDVSDVPGKAALYGSQFHKAAEDYGREGTSIPKEFKQHKGVLDTLLGHRGEKYFELEMGIKKECGVDAPCEFSDETRWFRCIADLVVIDGDTAISVDYKTSKSSRYADLRQLDGVAAALFLHFPGVNTIKSGLLFVECGELVTKKHTRDKLSTYLQVFDKSIDNLQSCMNSGVWNAKTSPLCNYCPVSQCEHHPEGSGITWKGGGK